MTAALDWKVQRALDSFRSLAENIDQLSEEEVYEALEFEVVTRRRSSVINRLIAKAAVFNSKSFLNSMKEKYHDQARTEGRES
jgi:hypothetical protein